MAPPVVASLLNCSPRTWVGMVVVVVVFAAENAATLAVVEVVDGLVVVELKVEVVDGLVVDVVVGGAWTVKHAPALRFSSPPASVPPVSLA